MSTPPSFVSTIRKAITAALFAAAAALGAAMLDGHLATPEAIVAAGMGLLAGAATYQVPNAESFEDEPRETVARLTGRDDGA